MVARTDACAGRHAAGITHLGAATTGRLVFPQAGAALGAAAAIPRRAIGVSRSAARGAVAIVARRRSAASARRATEVTRWRARRVVFVVGGPRRAASGGWT